MGFKYDDRTEYSSEYDKKIFDDIVSALEGKVIERIKKADQFGGIIICLNDGSTLNIDSDFFVDVSWLIFEYTDGIK